MASDAAVVVVFGHLPAAAIARADFSEPLDLLCSHGRPKWSYLGKGMQIGAWRPDQPPSFGSQAWFAELGLTPAAFAGSPQVVALPSVLEIGP